jgi:ribosomal protein S27AE
MSTKLYDISEGCRKGDELESYPYIGEIDIDLHIGEVFKVEDEYYAPGVISPMKHLAGVRKAEIDLDPEDKDYEDNLTCPYCGYVDSDSWELSDSEDEHTCGRCGATMSFERVVTVEYNSSPVKPPQIINAEWK